MSAVEEEMISFVVAIVLFGVLSTCAASENCTVNSDNLCRCSAHNFSIDISKLFSYPKNITAKNSTTLYQYSPCKANSHNATEPPAVVWLYNGKWYALGRQSETEWIVNSTNPLKFQIVYHGGDKKNKHKRSAVFLFTHKDLQNPNVNYMSMRKQIYRFQVESNLNVTVQSTSAHEAGKQVPVGVVGLVIIAVCLCALVTYCVSGGIYKYQRKEARGCDIIPHYWFWRNLPYLVKDGFLLTISPCTNHSKTYEKL